MSLPPRALRLPGPRRRTGSRRTGGALALAALALLAGAGLAQAQSRAHVYFDQFVAGLDRARLQACLPNPAPSNLGPSAGGPGTGAPPYAPGGTSPQPGYPPHPGNQGNWDRPPAHTMPVGLDVMIAIDSSGSMRERLAPGVSRMEGAKAAIARFLRALPPDSRAGLVVFGHEGQDIGAAIGQQLLGSMLGGMVGGGIAMGGGCTSSAELLVPLSPLNQPRLQAMVDRMQPTGSTPLAQGMRTAGMAFGAPVAGRRRVLFVVSDGRETCNGDPVAEARQLERMGVETVIIGLRVPGDVAQELSRVARSGSGSYVDAQSSDALADVLATKVDPRNADPRFAPPGSGRPGYGAGGPNYGRPGAGAPGYGPPGEGELSNRPGGNAQIGFDIRNATSCMDEALGRESRQFNDRMQVDRTRGRIGEGDGAAAFSLLRERHRRIREQIGAWQAAVNAGRGRDADRIRRELGR